MVSDRDSEFVDLLVDKKFLSPSEAKILRSKFRGDLFALLLHVAKNSAHRKHELGRFWGDFIGIVYLDLTRTIIQYRLLEKLPEDFVRKNLVMPVYEFGGAISIVMPDPKNQTLLDQAESYLDAFVSPAFSFPDQIEDALEIGYQSKSTLTQLLEKTQITTIRTTDAPVSVEELQKMSGESAIIEFTRGL
ncbi:MAG: hypothetical protein JXB04_01770, partial [Kiritimatiellae bacterium]|nr:hypothetical protein [Kiritimatiellia bacterium]